MIAPRTVERDFLWSLLNLGLVEDLDGLLDDALALVLDIARAHRGYIEIRGPHGHHRWSRVTGLARHEVANVRESLSSGIMREAIELGKTVHTASAQQDPRFAKLESVQRLGIEAAVCAVIGAGNPVGVVYLQGRDEPGPFSTRDVERVELFARHVAPHADRLARLEVAATDPTAPYRERLDCDRLVGCSQALADMLEQIAMVANLDLAVMLNGPTGAGKTAVARVIHDNSSRAEEPFVELNCAAIPQELVESELFGAEPGAHSTATRRIRGKVDAADRGTLFLDEIAEMPMASQAKLLQFLQSGQYWPLGSATPRQSRARIIAATNQDLLAAVDNRTFRADLYYRLNVFTIRVPGLDERQGDRIPLAKHFLELATARHDFPQMIFSPSARHLLSITDFPGNVRELAHVVERGAVVAAGTGTVQVGAEHLFPMRRSRTGVRIPRTYAEHLREFQRGLLTAVLEEHGGNVSAAARALDITRSHLYNLMRSLEITPKRGR